MNACQPDRSRTGRTRRAFSGGGKEGYLRLAGGWEQQNNNNNKLVEFLGPFLQEDEGVSGYEAVCGTYTWGWDGCWLGLELYLKLTGGLIIFSPVF